MSDKLRDNYVAFREVELDFYELKIGQHAALTANPENYEVTARKIKNYLFATKTLYVQLIEQVKERAKEVVESDRV